MCELVFLFTKKKCTLLCLVFPLTTTTTTIYAIQTIELLEVYIHCIIINGPFVAIHIKKLWKSLFVWMWIVEKRSLHNLSWIVVSFFVDAADYCWTRKEWWIEICKIITVRIILSSLWCLIFPSSDANFQVIREIILIKVTHIQKNVSQNFKIKNIHLFSSSFITQINALEYYTQKLQTEGEGCRDEKLFINRCISACVFTTVWKCFNFLCVAYIFMRSKHNIKFT